jgi:uncharacterized protein (DUF58 family)
VPPAAVAALDFSLARRAGGPLPGEHRAAGVGDGTELAQVRPYEFGDDPRMIDPAASARTSVAHVRRHVPERALTCWLVLDLSPSMAFGTADRLKSDVAEGVAGVVAQLAVRRGGRLAVLTCGAPVARLLPPRGGRGAAAAVRRLLAEGVGPDGAVPVQELAGALWRVRALARFPGAVFVVSDFRDDSDWERALRAVGARHRTVAVEVVDRREGDLPDAGRIVFTDPESGAQVEADTSSPRVRRAFAAAERARRQDVAEHIRRVGAAHVVLRTDGDWLREFARKLR